MTRFVLSILIGLGISTAIPTLSTADDAGPFLGQKPPGAAPVLFAPGIVSTDTREWGMAVTPDGGELFFGISSQEATAIVHTAMEGERWTPVAIADFSGEYDDFDMTMAPHGNRIYFTSSRPEVPGGEEPENTDIWFVDRTENGWGTPIRLPEPINTTARELYPSESSDGFLYFFSSRPGGFGGSDLYSVEIKKDDFSDPKNLGPNVNTEAGESDACVSPDGSYLVFTSSREDGHGKGDLYVTFKQPDGGWSRAVNLGPTVNTEATEFCPSLTPDGRYLFFTSNRSRPRPIPNMDGGLRKRIGVTLKDVPPDIDIYWMDASFIDELRP